MYCISVRKERMDNHDGTKMVWSTNASQVCTVDIQVVIGIGPGGRDKDKLRKRTGCDHTMQMIF